MFAFVVLDLVFLY